MDHSSQDGILATRPTYVSLYCLSHFSWSVLSSVPFLPSPASFFFGIMFSLYFYLTLSLIEFTLFLCSLTVLSFAFVSCFFCWTPYCCGSLFPAFLLSSRLCICVQTVCASWWRGRCKDLLSFFLPLLGMIKDM